MGITDRIRTLDSSDAYEPAALNILLNVGESLYTYPAGSAQLTPLLATAMPTVSSDGLTYTIPLRQGVKFHDGSPFNAAAMAFSLQRFIKNGGRPAFLLADIVNSVEAKGDSELTIRLKSPFSGFTAMLAFPGACAVSPKAHTMGKFQPEKVVATGHYRLNQYVENTTLSLDRFEQYWGKPAANDGIDIQFFTTSSTLLNALKTDAVDLAFQTLEPSQVESLVQEKESEGWMVVSQNSGLIRYLVLNVTQPPLDRKEVRQAFAAAVNRTLLQERAFLNQATPLYSLVPDSFADARPAFKEAYGDRNVERARELLAKAGYTAAQPARTTLWYASDNPRGELIASTLKASLEQDLGGVLMLDLKTVESATLFSNLNKGTVPVALLSWAPDFLDPDNYLQPFVLCDRAENGVCVEGSSFEHGSFFNSDKLNQLVRQQRTERDAAKRSAQLASIQQQVANDVPFIPLLQGIDYVFGAPQVQGLQLAGKQAIPLWLVKKV
jgi:peptide/nickel transport system substrate-binding protein